VFPSLTSDTPLLYKLRKIWMAKHNMTEQHALARSLPGKAMSAYKSHPIDDVVLEGHFLLLRVL
jgi:hypothetical protein